MALLRLPENCLGLVQAVEIYIGIGKIEVVGLAVRRQAQGLPRLLKEVLPVAQAAGNVSKISVRRSISRINLFPQLVCLRRFLEFAGRHEVVETLDIDAFALAHIFAQREGHPCVFRRPPHLVEVAVDGGQSFVRFGKIRVEFQRALIEGQRCRLTCCQPRTR